jgi:hypothetical protein
MSRHMTERTTVRLPPDLLKRAKRKAAAEGRTLTSLIVDGLRLVTSESAKAAKTKRVMPPISKATGGLMPGVDLTSLSSFEEMDDLDYVRRMKHWK